MSRRVVITGLGVVSPIGIGKDEFSDSLKEGKSGVKKIDLEMDSCWSLPRTSMRGRNDRLEFCDNDIDKLLPIKIAGQINGNFQNEAPQIRDYVISQRFGGAKSAEVSKIVGTKADKNPHQDRFIAFAKTAAEEALFDAQAENFVRNNQRAGVIVSSSKGGMETFAKVAREFIENGPISIPQNFLDNFLPEMASYNIAKEFKMSGPIYNIPSACSTGLTSIIYAYNLIKNNQLDLVIAGATDASITLPLINFYYQMGILAQEKISPFDKNRNGFVIGEGSGVLILEEKEHAIKRGAKIYAEILEAQTSNDNFHPTEPDFKENNLAKLFKKLFNQSQIYSKEINYVNAHGTATPKGDLYETENIKEAFADTAYSIPISSTKSMHGHMLGASGAVELIGTILAMKGGFIPPTINYQEADPLCDLDYVPNKSREKEINLALKISMGFGGHLAIVLVKKAEV